VSMKALCLAAACISIGLGDLIVIIVAESNFIKNRVSNDFDYKLINFVHMCIIFLSIILFYNA
jgi:hypothetical protein